MDLHLRRAADQFRDETSVFPESPAVGCECKSVFPADNFASHHEDGSVGVDITALLKESNGVFCGVENNHGLSQKIEVQQVSYTEVQPLVETWYAEYLT